MAVLLNIQGDYELTFYKKNEKQCVNNETQAEILDKLQSGDYLISLNDKTVCDIKNLEEALYIFEIDPTEYNSYEFLEL